MNTVLKIFLSMSFSGSLLILALFLGKRFLKDKISRQWQYYIWLIVILRLLLPFGPEVNLLGKTYQAVDQVITQAAPLSQQQPASYASGNMPAPADNQEPNSENNPSKGLTAPHPLQEIGALLFNHIWLIWLLVALGMLIRKITSYQGFTRYIHAGLTPVSDIELLDQLSIVAGQAGIKKPIELSIDPLVSSPLLIGFFHPCIVLPSVDIPPNDFQYIILHELTHYKRRDMFYKWLVQITLCLHWFNPLVYLMSREITKACEFSCDEAVLTKMGQENAQDYGKTLLDAMAAVGKYKENLGAVTLSENKQLLKERLSAIMNFKRKSAVIRLLTGVLTLCVMFSAAFVGVYSVAAAADHTTVNPITAGNDNSEQAGMYTHTPSFTPDKQYIKTNTSSSSQQSDDWKDEFDWDWNWDWDDEKGEKWEEMRRTEYQAAGVTVDGKNYYYQGQLVDIFMDIRANKSFYTLDTNPAGTVNIKVLRDANDKITEVVYMTEAEVTELLEDMDELDEKIIPVDFNTVATGESIFLGEYTLSDGDEIIYDISAKTGNRIKVFFAKDEQEDVVYWSVDNLRQPGETLECIADFIVGPPATKPGTYKLYLQAPDGALGNVRGIVSIVSADAS